LIEDTFLREIVNAVNCRIRNLVEPFTTASSQLFFNTAVGAATGVTDTRDAICTGPPCIATASNHMCPFERCSASNVIPTGAQCATAAAAMRLPDAVPGFLHSEPAIPSNLSALLSASSTGR
jgi:hypothetical protein